jgi:hypothetical protein
LRALSAAGVVLIDEQKVVTVKRSKRAVILLFSFLFLLAGCNQGVEHGMSRYMIGSAIEHTMDDSSLFLHVGRIGCDRLTFHDSPGPYVPENNREWIGYFAAARAGLITIKPDGPHSWQVRLTDLGRSLSAPNWKTSRDGTVGCDSELIKFPVAQRILIEVSSVSGTSEKTEAKYKWKWVPLEVAARLKAALSPPQIQDLNHELIQSFDADGRFDLATADQSEIINTGTVMFEKKDGEWRSVR